MTKNATSARHQHDDVDVEITPEMERQASGELAQRIRVTLIDPSIVDEEERPPEDRSPGYANALMPGKPASVERATDLDTLDWELIAKALQHYAACGMREASSELEIMERIWPF